MSSAEWIDSFFGSEIYTSEVNRTYLRFRLTSFVEDGEGFDNSARFKLRLRLPNTEKRFRVTIASDLYEIDREDDATDDVISDRLEETDDNLAAGLEYQFNTYFDTELSGNLKESNVRVRYRRQVWRKWLIFEVVPQLAWYKERDFKTVAGIMVRLEIWMGRYKNMTSHVD